MPETNDDGARFRIKVLYVALAILAIWTLIQQLQISAHGSSIDYMQNNQVQKYTVDNLATQITTIQNQIQYSIPSKYTTDGLQSSIDSLFARMNSCKCY
jgi:hypothetical protein